MSKSLPERILMRTKQGRATRRAKNYAAFLAQREEIKQSLEIGWSALQIWETLHQEGKITTGYPAFCRQVNRRILACGAATSQAPVKTTVTPAAKPKSPDVGGFTYESTPNQEDLL